MKEWDDKYKMKKKELILKSQTKRDQSLKELKEHYEKLPYKPNIDNKDLSMIPEELRK